MTTVRPSGTAPPLEPRTRVQFLPGIGPQRALAFERLGIITLEHLVRHYPRTWLDASRFVKVSELRPGELVATNQQPGPGQREGIELLKGMGG